MVTGLRRAWVLAYLAAEAFGIGVGAAGFRLTDVAYPEPRTALSRAAVWLILVTAGALEGAAIGTATWLVLRHRLPQLRAARWIGAMVVVAAAGWAAGMLPSTVNTSSAADSVGPPAWLGLLLVVVGAAAGGAVVGAAQAWAARLNHPARWIGLNAVAWAAALVEIFAIASLPQPGWPVAAVAVTGLVAGIGSGLIVGALTSTGLPLTQKEKVDVTQTLD